VHPFKEQRFQIVGNLEVSAFSGIFRGVDGLNCRRLIAL
jgi:hypothetical protein